MPSPASRDSHSRGAEPQQRTRSTRDLPCSASPSAAEQQIRQRIAARQTGSHTHTHSQTHTHAHTHTDWPALLCFALVALVSLLAYPQQDIREGVTLRHVFYCGWITAVATGAGVLPFFFISKKPNKFYMGISNAIAGGMMIAASISLVLEAADYTAEEFGILSHFRAVFPMRERHSMWRTMIGFLLGFGGIFGLQKVLDRFEDLSSLDLNGASAQKMFLMIFVMTLHSFTEGVGLGVSFGGQTGHKLGRFITFSLAFHNVPEGLAVGLVTAGRVSPLRSTLWAIFTSLPQPLFAVPAYMFIERFAPLLPGGLGFAAGAMSYVAFFELLSEAWDDTSFRTMAVTSVLSCIAMISLQDSLKNSM